MKEGLVSMTFFGVYTYYAVSINSDLQLLPDRKTVSFSHWHEAEKAIIDV